MPWPLQGIRCNHTIISQAVTINHDYGQFFQKNCTNNHKKCSVIKYEYFTKFVRQDDFLNYYFDYRVYNLIPVAFCEREYTAEAREFAQDGVITSHSL